MDEERKTQYLLALMQMGEDLDDLIAFTEKVEATPANRVTLSTWHEVQSKMSDIRELLESCRQSIPQGGKIVDNDAFLAHAIAVLGPDWGP